MELQKTHIEYTSHLKLLMIQQLSA